MWFFDTNLIIDRLKESEFCFEKVEGAAEYAAIPAIGSFRPNTVYVVLAGERNGAGTSPQPRNKAAGNTTFGVICVARNFRDTTGKAAQDDIAKVAGRVRQALIGWAPKGCMPCVWQQGDVMDYDKTNLLWIDVFTTSHVIGASNG